MKLLPIAKLGILIAITVAAILIYMMRVSNSLPERSSIQARSYLSSAPGLREESPVYMLGVPIGEIDTISLEENQVVVRFSLRDIYSIPNDSKIRINASGLLGNTSLEVIPGSSGTFIQDNAVLQSVDSGPSLGSAISSFEPIVEKLDIILEEVLASLTITTTLIEENLIVFRDLLSSSDGIVSTVNEQIDRQLESISELLTVSIKTINSIDTLVGDNNEEFTSSINTLNTTLNEVNALIASINQGEGSLGKIVTDDTLYNSLVETSDSARDFLDNTLGPELQIGYRAEVMTAAFNDMEVKSHVDLKIIPQNLKSHYLFSFVSSPRESTSTTITSEIENPASGAPIVNVKQTESRSIQSSYGRISAQIARNFFDDVLTIRGGIIESSAGFGLEVRPIPQLEFAAEIFDFTNSNAYLRSSITAYPFFDPKSDNFFKWLYVSAGVDDILAAYKRQYYFGLGLRFSDSYLRSLVGLAPLANSIR